MEVAMLERFFLKPQTVDRIMGCWLGPRIELYVMALCEQGYSARSIIRRVPILTEFAEFAAARHADRVDRAETLLDAFVVDWLSARRLDRPADARRRDRNLVRGTVRHFFSLVVSRCDYHPDKAAWADPFAGQVSGFFEYLREERGLRPSSITTTSTTCAGSSAISIRWAAATSARWHCP
jgi:integrase/recombinase XerD